MTILAESLEEKTEARRGVAQAAGLIGIGGMASRLLGLVREVVIAAQFGTGPLTAAYIVASTVPTAIYDFLIGGLLSSALVPVFSEYATRDDDNAALWALASRVVSLVSVILAAFVVLTFLFADQITYVFTLSSPNARPDIVSVLLRFIAPAMLFFGISGVFTGLLYALKRFTWVSFTAAIYNLGIIIGAAFFSQRFTGEGRIIGLALGVVLGSVLHLALTLPDLRHVPLRWQMGAFWRDPGLRRIGWLYVPVALSFVVSNIGIVIDRNLAYGTAAAQTIAWMRNATTLIQFPLGLVAATISLAVLPNLARYAALADNNGFRTMLKTGLRMVLVLIIPATIGLFVLAGPIVRLLFERGEFVPYDTYWTANALRLYLLGMTFAAIDQVLIIAFYSRQDTWTPALVGMATVGVYLIVALPLVHPLQMQGLVLANSVQHFAHALILVWLLRRRLGDIVGGVGQLTGRVLIAALVMGIVVWLVAQPSASLMTGQLGTVVAVALPAMAGLITYMFAVTLLRIEEAETLGRLVGRRLKIARC